MKNIVTFIENFDFLGYYERPAEPTAVLARIEIFPKTEGKKLIAVSPKSKPQITLLVFDLQVGLNSFEEIDRKK